jgi:hypothetical protein
MDFSLRPLSKDSFRHLFTMSSEQLAQHRAVRVPVTKKPGFPCRVSLQDAEPGEEVLLTNFLHLDVSTPFRSSHAVYVRPEAAEATLAVNEVPEMLRSRPLSLRAWTLDGMLAGADLAAGSELERVIAVLFADPCAAYIHAHFAKPGCYAARIDRA